MNERHFSEQIAQAGGRAFVVGGWVRDKLLQRAAHDKDYVVTGLTQQTFETLFPAAFCAGNAFPIYRLEIDGAMSEVAFARSERKSGIGYKGFSVLFSPATGIEEDLYRRDTTINAMAIDLAAGTLIDPFGGNTDLADRTIRAVSHHFRDDPVRALRAARQAAQLQFAIEPGTLTQMRACRDEIPQEPAERLVKELASALETPAPAVFFRNLEAAGILDVAYPQLHALVGVPQPAAHHPEGDAFEHTMLSVDRAARLSPRAEIRFAALAHDLGKALTPAEELPQHHRHDRLGLAALAEWNRRMTLPRRWIRCAAYAICEHMRICGIVQPGKIVDVLNALRQHPIGFDGIETVIRADGKTPPDFLRDRQAYLAAMDAVRRLPIPHELRGREIGNWRREREIAAARRVTPK